MVDAHFRLDGASSISTPDVNQLDADTAHVFQSIGVWKNVLADSEPSHTGGFKSVSIAAAVNGDSSPDLFDVDPSETVIFSCWAKSKVPGSPSEFRVKMWSYLDDLGSGTISSVNGDYADTEDDWTQYFVGMDVPAGANKVRPQMDNIIGTEDILVSNMCLREGSDPTFVPSLRIVGDVDAEGDMALNDWTPGDNVPISNYNNLGAGYDMSFSATGLFWRIGDGTTARSSTALIGALVDGTRHVIQQTFAEAIGQVLTYVDTVEVSDQTTTVGPVGAELTVPFQVGRHGWFGGGFLEGEIFSTSYKDGIGGPKVQDLTTVGAPAGDIPDLSTWQGPDGRIYTAHGNVVNVPGDGGGGPNIPPMVIMRADQPVRDIVAGDVQIHRVRI